MTSPKDYLTDREKLMYQIERLFDLAQGEEFGNTHAREHFENDLLSLLTSEVEKERERLLEVIGEDEDTGENTIYSGSPEWKKNAILKKQYRNELRAEQRKALSDIGGRGK